MKKHLSLKRLISSAIIMFFIATSFGQQSSMGSDGILGKLQTVIETAENNDMEVVRIEADLIRTRKEITRTLDPSYLYSIIAVASNRIKDIDIEVYKKVDYEWVLIKKDDDMNDVAVVQINPSDFAEYRIVVVAYQFYSGFDVGHYGLVVIHD